MVTSLVKITHLQVQLADKPGLRVQFSLIKQVSITGATKRIDTMINHFRNQFFQFLMSFYIFCLEQIPVRKIGT